LSYQSSCIYQYAKPYNLSNVTKHILAHFVHLHRATVNALRCINAHVFCTHKVKQTLQLQVEQVTGNAQLQPAAVPIPALPQVIVPLPEIKKVSDAPVPRQPPNGQLPVDPAAAAAAAAAAVGANRNASSGSGSANAIVNGRANGGIASVPGRRRVIRDPDDIDMPDPAKVKPPDPAAVAEAAKVPVAPLQPAPAAELRRLFDLGVKVSVNTQCNDTGTSM
jgi:hypothetical protein